MITMEDEPINELEQHLKDRIHQMLLGGADPEEMLDLIETWDQEVNPAHESRRDG